MPPHASESEDADGWSDISKDALAARLGAPVSRPSPPQSRLHPSAAPTRGDGQRSSGQGASRVEEPKNPVTLATQRKLQYQVCLRPVV